MIIKRAPKSVEAILKCFLPRSTCSVLICTVGSGEGGWKVFFATKQTLLCTLMSWSDQPSMSKHPKKRKGGLWKGRHWKEWLPGPILCTLLSWSELWRWTLNTAPDQIHLSKSIVHQMHLCSRMNAIRCLLDLVQWSSHFNFQRGFRLQTKGFFNQWSPHHCHGHRINGLSEVMIWRRGNYWKIVGQTNNSDCGRLWRNCDDGNGGASNHHLISPLLTKERPHQISSTFNILGWFSCPQPLPFSIICLFWMNQLVYF